MATDRTRALAALLEQQQLAISCTLCALREEGANAYAHYLHGIVSDLTETSDMMQEEIQRLIADLPTDHRTGS